MPRPHPLARTCVGSGHETRIMDHIMDRIADRIVRVITWTYKFRVRVRVRVRTCGMHKTITVYQRHCSATTTKLGTNFGAVRTLKAGTFLFIFFFAAFPLCGLVQLTCPEADRQVSRPGGWRHEIRSLHYALATVQLSCLVNSY